MATGQAFWSTQPQCLDEEFEAADTEADYEMCCAIAAGRRGLHPDAWGDHDPLTLWPPRFREPWVPVELPFGQPLGPAVKRPEPKPKPRGRPRKLVLHPPKLVLHPRRPRPRPLPEIFAGEIELTCDECHRRFGTTLGYGPGLRAFSAEHLRALGREKGWTHIVGRDRCPECSGIPAPDQVGEGAGERERDEQHADGG